MLVAKLLNIALVCIITFENYVNYAGSKTYSGTMKAVFLFENYVNYLDARTPWQNLDYTRKVKDVDQAPRGSEGYIFNAIISKPFILWKPIVLQCECLTIWFMIVCAYLCYLFLFVVNIWLSCISII